MITDRNRSEGWQWAKLSGHRNEDIATEHVKNDQDLQRRILRCAHKEGTKIIDIQVGGLNETDIDSVLGDKTKNKTDLHLYLEDGSSINISIKKSLAGQVYLISATRFMRGFEKQFGKTIPEDVKRAIRLFWGEADDVLEISQEYNISKQTIKGYEFRKHRLVKETLDNYNHELCQRLLNWFNENLLDIMIFCFSSGLALDRSEWADVIWYVNYLGEENPDKMFYLKDLGQVELPEAFYGTTGGGTTIQLPFGFVQWHQEQMQFHHKFEKILDLIHKL